MEELFNDSENAMNETKTLNGETNEQKPPLNKAALIAAILNLVGGILYIAFTVLFFAGMTNVNSETMSDDQKVGIIFFIILIFPILFITVTPSGIAGGIWGIARSVINFLQLRGEHKSRLWVLVVGIVFKILVGVIAGFGLIMFASMDKSINPTLFYSGAIVGALALILSFAVIPFEFKAIK